MIGDIWVVHVGPEADRAGEILPHALIFPYAFLALVDERLQSVFFDLLLAVKTEQLLNLQLHRETVGIPACLSRHHAALHRAVSRDHVLDNTGQHMADVRFAVGCRRPVIEDVIRAAFALLHTLLKNVIVVPELFDFLFTGDKIHVSGNFPVHFSLPFYFSTRVPLRPLTNTRLRRTCPER